MKDYSKVTIGVGGFVIRNKNEVLLIKRNSDLSVWTIPSGYIEGKENLFETIKREVKEETNININSKGIIGVRQRFTKKENNNIWLVVISDYVSGKIIPDNSEISQAKFISFSQALKEKITPVTRQVIRLNTKNKLKILTTQKNLSQKNYKFFA